VDTTSGAQNAAQAMAWNGDRGRHWADNAERQDRMLGAFSGALLDAAGIADGDRVLDLGCGAGGTTLAAARRAGGGSALGADLSALLLAEAARRAERAGIGNARFEQADVQVHPFPAGGFDIALSRFGVMFFDDPAAAWGNIARALRPGGRLAFCCWREVALNEFFSVPFAAVAPHVPARSPAGPGAPGQLSLASPDRVRDLLGGAGFTGIGLSEVTTTLRIGQDPEDAAAYITGMGPAYALLAGTSPETRAAAIQSLRDTFATRATKDGVHLGAAVWLVTATKPL
jgi:SAM-dependent methyltransferase